MDYTSNGPIGSLPAPALADAVGSTFPHWLVGSRADRVALILLGVWLLNAFDLMLTILADAQGILQESNPLAAWVIPLGPLAITVYKIALLVPPTIVLLRYRMLLLSEIAAAGVFVIYVTVAVRWRMVYELHMVTSSNDYYAIPLLDHFGH